MLREIWTLTKAHLKSMIRQKTTVFSSIILPVIIIFAAWWVTADLPMFFLLDNEYFILTNMIDVHVYTSGLTAMGITAGIFAFILTVEHQKNYSRLKQVGYSQFEISSGTFAALLIVLLLSAIIAAVLSYVFTSPDDVWGFLIAILLITLIYAAFGHLVANIYPKFIGGILIVLLVSFTDLMLISNPMGMELYLDKWTYIMPGFWSTQLILEAGFIGFPINIGKEVGYSLLYFFVLLFLVQLIRYQVGRRIWHQIRKVKHRA